MSFVNLIPVCERILAKKIEEYSKRFNIAYEGAAERAEIDDLGEFVLENINILIARQKYALLLEHYQWLTMLFMSYLPHIYGEGDPRIVLLRERFRKIFDQKINVLVCPRRWAKTTTSSYFIASCLFSIRREIWVTLAARLGIAKAALKTVRRMLVTLCNHYGFTFYYLIDSVQELLFLNYYGHQHLRAHGLTEITPSKLQRLYESDITLFSSIKVLSATAEGVRGPEGSVYNDEFLFENGEAQVAIVPLVTQGSYIMVNTCTRNESDENSQLENILASRTSDGKSIVNSLVWTKICPKCRDDGKATCKHPIPKPPWISTESEAIELYMKTIPTDNDASVELENEAQSREVTPFQEGELPEFDDPTWVYPHVKLLSLEFIVVSTDPNGAAESEHNSHFITTAIGVTFRGVYVVSFFPFIFFLLKGAGVVADDPDQLDGAGAHAVQRRNARDGHGGLDHRVELVAEFGNHDDDKTDHVVQWRQLAEHGGLRRVEARQRVRMQRLPVLRQHHRHILL